MARPTLPAIVLAVLAVAGPAAADVGAPVDPATAWPGETLDPALDAGSPAFVALSPLPMASVARAADLDLEIVGFGGDATSCRLYALDPISLQSSSIIEADPDNCIRMWLMRTLEELPLSSGPDHSSVTPAPALDLVVETPLPALPGVKSLSHLE